MSLHGIPYDLSGDRIHTALKHYIFPALDTLLHEYQPTPWILLVTKGPLKIRLLEELILAIDIFFPFNYRYRTFLTASILLAPKSPSSEEDWESQE